MYTVCGKPISLCNVWQAFLFWHYLWVSCFLSLCSVSLCSSFVLSGLHFVLYNVCVYFVWNWWIFYSCNCIVFQNYDFFGHSDFLFLFNIMLTLLQSAIPFFHLNFIQCSFNDVCNLLNFHWIIYNNINLVIMLQAGLCSTF